MTYAQNNVEKKENNDMTERNGSLGGKGPELGGWVVGALLLFLDLEPRLNKAHPELWNGT